MEYKFSGIILSKTDVAEVDRIYNIFTLEAGKIRALGKGTRNPQAKLAGSLEPVTMSEIYVSRTKGLGKITGAIVLDNFSTLKADYDYLREIFKVIRIMEKIITDEEKDRKIFMLLLSYLKVLNKLANSNGDKEKLKIISLGFVFKLLESAGYGLDMVNCVRCRKKLLPEENLFSAQNGGVVCPNCMGFNKRVIRIRSAAIKLIRIFQKNKLENFVKISVSISDIKNTESIADEMVSWITG